MSDATVESSTTFSVPMTYSEPAATFNCTIALDSGRSFRVEIKHDDPLAGWLADVATTRRHPSLEDLRTHSFGGRVLAEAITRHPKGER